LPTATAARAEIGEAVRKSGDMREWETELEVGPGERVSVEMRRVQILAARDRKGLWLAGESTKRELV